MLCCANSGLMKFVFLGTFKESESRVSFSMWPTSVFLFKKSFKFRPRVLSVLDRRM